VTRAYRASTGEHFYTTSAAEAVNAGYALEASPYFYLATNDPQHDGFQPFYRCFIPSAGKHFYTQSVGCEGAPATNEGELGLVAEGPVLGSVPLYRLFNPASGDHFYTTSAAESQSAQLHAGYHYEAVAGYVWLSP
jgi:hypothetical protein